MAHKYPPHDWLSQHSRKRAVDTLAYSVGVVGNFAVVPQIVRAWQGPAPGLAIQTWLLFVGIGLVWLCYAILHRQKPLIVAQIVCLGCDAAVVAGWAVNNWLR